MANGDYRVAFVDLAGTLIYKTVTAQVPRVGDHIDLPTQRVAGVVDLVTWQVGGGSMFPDLNSCAFVRIKPHA